MRFLMVLFLAITLSLSPSAAFCRDVKKYTLQHNRTVVENLGKEIYEFVAGLDDLQDGRKARKQIVLGITDIISEYNCKEDLYVTGSAVVVMPTGKIITDILVIINLFNSNVDGEDKVKMILNIRAVKDGLPINVKSNRIQV